MADSSLIAIGYYCGPFFGAVDDRPEYWEVRIGEESVQLTSFDHLNMWNLCRGVWGEDAARACHDRESIFAAAETLEIHNPGAVLDRLLTTGLVREIEPRTALDFAAEHRVDPLLVGYGNTAEDPQHFLLGATPQHIYARLDAAEYDAWVVTPTSRTIRDAVDEVTGSADDALAAAEIAHLLPLLLSLVAKSAMYIDVPVGAALPSKVGAYAGPRPPSIENG